MFQFPFLTKVNSANTTHKFSVLGAKGHDAWSSSSSSRSVFCSGSSLATLAYRDNPVAFRAVRLIAETASSLPWLLYQGDHELTDHKLLHRLAKPNRRHSGQEWREQLYTNLLLAGNAYVHALLFDEEVQSLDMFSPERVAVVTDDEGWPEAYHYHIGRNCRHYPAEGEPIAPICHIKCYNPDDLGRGQSPLEAAKKSLEIHQAATEWNQSLLARAATPSGALVYQSDKGGGRLSDNQFSRLKQELEDNFQGRLNAGRPLLLDGGLDWRPMSHSPKDMDFLEMRNAAARDIALTFGVPPMLLGIPGDNTFANYREANRALWRETILPLINKLASALETWLAPLYGDELRLDIDRDRIEALAEDRSRLWNQVSQATFLTDDEKREALGFSALKSNS